MAAKQKTSRTNSVVMSARVWPDVEAGFRKLADETGLSYAGLFANALNLLRADQGIVELVAANKAYEETFRRIVRPKPRAKAAASRRPASRP